MEIDKSIKRHFLIESITLRNLKGTLPIYIIKDLKKKKRNIFKRAKMFNKFQTYTRSSHITKFSSFFFFFFSLKKLNNVSKLIPFSSEREREMKAKPQFVFNMHAHSACRHISFYFMHVKTPCV